MRTKLLVAAGLAALVLTAGTAAALPGNAPVDVGANDDAADNADERADAADADERADDDANDTDRAGGPDAAPVEQGDRGPPVSLPEQVPDHVSQIHDTVRQFLSGDLSGSLGDAISDVTPDDDGNETSGNATAA
jgi:hypothetical protein